MIFFPFSSLSSYFLDVLFCKALIEFFFHLTLYPFRGSLRVLLYNWTAEGRAPFFPTTVALKNTHSSSPLLTRVEQVLGGQRQKMPRFRKKKRGPIVHCCKGGLKIHYLKNSKYLFPKGNWSFSTKTWPSQKEGCFSYC